MFDKPFLWNASANLLNLCVGVWQPLSRPEEAQLIINLLSLIQWHFSVFHSEEVEYEIMKIRSYSYLSRAGRQIVQVCWVAYITKLIEYLDTVIFVLRKKDSQISFLHVFHHTSVPVISWLGVSYGPGGYNTIFPMLNSFVHVWMYLYYCIASLGTEFQKYLGWKKYLTSLQLAQFAFVFLYFVHLCFFAQKSCNLSPLFIVLNLGHTVIYFGLFMNFYLNSYKQLSGISKYRSAKFIPKKEK
ncbi:Elongation of very long chain fatty acids protein 7 [Araneus ventricosus]|uniref:Elongation of very long chain fatty acids protein n=1 Tax=Araneus ventricosus TaxID=182803 RepID=A0A4Y2FNF7_ARAVE|nr:Elongation of very long chain fatty acids protein 7 [Araneus ventricosus]